MKDNVEAQGFYINKITLRYSMINRLPFDVVSRCYCANLDYIANHQLKRHLDTIFSLLSVPDSCLAQRKIIDVARIDCLRDSDFETIAKYRTVLTTCAMIEQWLRQLPGNVVSH